MGNVKKQDVIIIMYKYILLLLLLLTLFCGCKNSNLEVESEALLNDSNLEDKTQENNIDKPIRYSDLEEAISNTIINCNIGKYTEGEYQTESHINLLIDESNELVTVYTMALYSEYTFNAQLLKNVSGSHSAVAITFSKDDGYYSLIEYWMPLSASEYANSIRDRFPESIWDQALDTQQFIEGQLKDTEKKALEYFTKNR